MTIQEVIDEVSMRMPTQFDLKALIRWIDECEQGLWEKIFRHYENSPCRPKRHSENDLTESLLLPFPHDGLYAVYVCSQIDLLNFETDHYNNDITEYNTRLQAFADFWKTTHVHKPVYFSRIMPRGY